MKQNNLSESYDKHGLGYSERLSGTYLLSFLMWNASTQLMLSLFYKLPNELFVAIGTGTWSDTPPNLKWQQYRGEMKWMKTGEEAWSDVPPTSCSWTLTLLMAFSQCNLEGEKRGGSTSRELVKNRDKNAEKISRKYRIDILTGWCELWLLFNLNKKS